MIQITYVHAQLPLALCMSMNFINSLSDRLESTMVPSSLSHMYAVVNVAKFGPLVRKENATRHVLVKLNVTWTLPMDLREEQVQH